MLAVLCVLSSGRFFVFSGDGTAYARFVAARIQHWLLTATFASVALVVSVPVIWHGTKGQVFVAVVFALLAAIILVFTYGMLA